MKRSVSILFAFAAFAVVPAMKADSFNFALSNSVVSIDGVITLGAEVDPGVYQIANITGTFTDTNLGIEDANIDSMVAGYGTDTGGYLVSSDDSWYYSNLVYYPGTPLFDSWGGPLVNVGPDEVNWWSVGNGVYEVAVSPTGQTQDYLDFQYVTETPEPGSLMLLGTGLLLLAGGVFWRSRGAAPEANSVA